MASYSLISPQIKAYVRLLRNRDKLPVRKVAELTGVSKSSVSRICRNKVKTSKPREAYMRRKGRPLKLSARHKRLILKEFLKARSEHGNITVGSLLTTLNFDLNVSERTVSRFLNQSGYKYYQARKKGLLSR